MLLSLILSCYGSHCTRDNILTRECDHPLTADDGDGLRQVDLGPVVPEELGGEDLVVGDAVVGAGEGEGLRYSVTRPFSDCISFIFQF